MIFTRILNKSAIAYFPQMSVHSHVHGRETLKMSRQISAFFKPVPKTPGNTTLPPSSGSGLSTSGTSMVSDRPSNPDSSYASGDGIVRESPVVSRQGLIDIGIVITSGHGFSDEIKASVLKCCGSDSVPSNFVRLLYVERIDGSMTDGLKTITG